MATNGTSTVTWHSYFIVRSLVCYVYPPPPPPPPPPPFQDYTKIAPVINVFVWLFEMNICLGCCPLPFKPPMCSPTSRYFLAPTVFCVGARALWQPSCCTWRAFYEARGERAEPGDLCCSVSRAYTRARAVLQNRIPGKFISYSR